MSTDWLNRALDESRARGYLGPGPIEPQIAHADGFAQCWQELSPTPPASFLDLGSGGGLPGLVLLERWRNRAVFTDSMMKRAKFLVEVMEWNDAPEGGVDMVGRAEEIARNQQLDGIFDLVSARSFGPPSVTAECGVRFLKVGGVMVISEPPNDSETGRWPAKGLKILGLRDLGRVRHGASFQVLQKSHATMPEFPRGIGVPRKRPLF